MWVSDERKPFGIVVEVLVNGLGSDDEFKTADGLQLVVPCDIDEDHGRNRFDDFLLLVGYSNVECLLAENILVRCFVVCSDWCSNSSVLLPVL